MPVPMLVSQVAFFRDVAVQLVNPDKFNVTWRIGLPAVSPDDARGRVASVWARHAGLRAYFPTHQRQAFAAADSPPPLRIVESDGFPDSEVGGLIAATADSASNTLRTTDGPLVRFVGIQRDGAVVDLMVIAHHLVFDLYSATIVERDVRRPASGHDRGEGTDRYDDAAAALDRFAHSTTVSASLDAWLTASRTIGAMPTSPIAVRTIRFPRVHTWEVTFSTRGARALMAGIPDGDRDRAATRLLSTLGRVLTRAYGGPVFCIELRNGREIRDRSLDSAPVLPPGTHRAVGWFNVEAGVFLPEYNSSPEEYEEDVRSARDRFDGGGVEYHFLRHVSAVDAVEREMFDAGHGPQLWINHVHIAAPPASDVAVGTARLIRNRPLTDTGSDPAFKGPPLAISAQTGSSFASLQLTFDTDIYSDRAVLDIVEDLGRTVGERFSVTETNGSGSVGH